MTNTFELHGDVAVIPLNQNCEALIDAGDLQRVQEWPGRWSALWSKESETFYVIGQKRGRRSILLHRWIMEPPTGLEVDHIHHNGLDNRRGEMRICTRRENAMNRRGVRKGSVSGMRGIHWHSKTSKWRASIWFNGRRRQLGVFGTAEEAAAARAQALGETAA